LESFYVELRAGERMSVEHLEKSGPDVYRLPIGKPHGTGEQRIAGFPAGMDSGETSLPIATPTGGSRMSQLKLYRPSNREQKLRIDEGEQEIISFPAFARRRGPKDALSILRRARLLHANRLCQHCGHPIVEPLELDDAVVSASNMPIPGTATLVGFHCAGCHREWPAEE
jgi:hypothetical protein